MKKIAKQKIKWMMITGESWLATEGVNLLVHLNEQMKLSGQRTVIGQHSGKS